MFVVLAIVSSHYRCSRDGGRTSLRGDDFARE